MEKKTVVATYERDTKRYHRYLIDEGQRVAGMLYVPRSEQVPETVEIRLRTKADQESETGVAK